jgi:hypothetical protein
VTGVPKGTLNYKAGPKSGKRRFMETWTAERIINAAISLTDSPSSFISFILEGCQKVKDDPDWIELVIKIKAEFEKTFDHLYSR